MWKIWLVVFLNCDNWVGSSFLDWWAEVQKWHFNFVFVFCYANIEKQYNIIAPSLRIAIEFTLFKHLHVIYKLLF